MERLYNVKAICDLFGCKQVTARKYMREMDHTENPLLVTERAVKAWIAKKTLPPESVTRQLIRKVVKGA
jgi:hypothetical protein